MATNENDIDINSKEKNEKMKQSLCSKLKELIKDTFESSTFHGLPNAFRSKLIGIRILWMIAILISISICSWQTIQTIVDYYDYKVNTNIQIISSHEADFPKVTICNLDPYNNQNPVVREIFK